MRLAPTKRAAYALRALHCLAGSSPTELVPSRRLASEAGIPQGFVSHVMGDLVRAGLVGSIAGSNGGYHVRRPLDAISLLDAIEAVEGATVARPAPDEASCAPGDPCCLDRALATATHAYIDVLASASFADIAGRPCVPADRLEGRIRPERNKP